MELAASERKSPLKGYKGEEPPCWMYKPAGLELVGAVGISSRFSVFDGSPFNKASIRALQSLADYSGIKTDPESLKKELKEGKLAFNLGGIDLAVMDSYETKGKIFVYAIIKSFLPNLDQLRNDCQRTCMPAECKPSWVCEPMSSSAAGFLGVAGRSSSLEAQYRMAVINGMKQVDYLYGVDVESKGRFKMQANSLGAFRYVSLDSSVNKKQSEMADNLKFLLTDACFYKNQLYARILCPDLEPLSSVSPEKWMENPNTSGFKGAVGIAERVASGMLSDQIRLAAKRAVVNLAQSKDIDIDEETEINRSSDNKGFFWRDLKTHSSVSLNARIMGVYFQTIPTGRRVFVWVVETE